MLDEKSDIESYGRPICMPIGQRIACGIVRIDGHLVLISMSIGRARAEYFNNDISSYTKCTDTRTFE
jgi:hypothetical protein